MKEIGIHTIAFFFIYKLKFSTNYPFLHNEQLIIIKRE